MFKSLHPSNKMNFTVLYQGQFFKNEIIFVIFCVFCAKTKIKFSLKIKKLHF